VTTCNGKDKGKALALANFNLAIPLNTFLEIVIVVLTKLTITARS
jgi:hypothetical protein